MRPAQTGESCVDYGQGEVVKRQLQVFHLTKRMTGDQGEKWSVGRLRECFRACCAAADNFPPPPPPLLDTTTTTSVPGRPVTMTAVCASS
jgi:hypothetical protein